MCLYVYSHNQPRPACKPFMSEYSEDPILEGREAPTQVRPSFHILHVNLLITFFIYIKFPNLTYIYFSILHTFIWTRHDLIQGILTCSLLQMFCICLQWQFSIFVPFIVKSSRFQVGLLQTACCCCLFQSTYSLSCKLLWLSFVSNDAILHCIVCLFSQACPN